jgi:hypothetical protein
MQDTSSLAGARPLRSRATTDGLDHAPSGAGVAASSVAPSGSASLGGTLEQYAAVVGPAYLGAVIHRGKINWPYPLHP